MPGLVPWLLSKICSVLMGRSTQFALAFVGTGTLSGAEPGPIPLKPTEWLVVAAGARGGRSPVRTDLLEQQFINGPWKTPKAGDPLAGDEKKKWVKVKAQENGGIRDQSLAGGYALWTFESPTSQMMVLEARGHGMVYTNGEPRPGDPYGYGYLALPVAVRKGTNEFLFFGGRGPIQAALRKPLGPVELAKDDATLPDLVANKAAKHWCGVVVRNCSENPLPGLILKAKLGSKETNTTCPTILASGIYKVPFEIEAGSLEKGEAKLEVSLILEKKVVAKQDYPLAVKDETSTRKVTFLSGLDHSAQYYGLVPARLIQEGTQSKPGLILSLHGASVEGIGQAACYAPKSWAHVIAPTNRRPFGFDWEDWGRMDALEVLEIGKKALGTDPARTWLTGHSMGGHGTWHLGVTYPDQFAAIAPSAGWVSMFTYAGVRKPETKSGVGRILSKATNPSDTVGLISNLATRGVYILHGDGDDNVPVNQARSMRLQLASFHPDFSYFEKKGAGHWWGNECVDWPPLSRFLEERKLPDPATTTEIEFRTFHPGVSSKMGWLEIRGQKEWGELSEARFRRDLIKGTIEGQTKNTDRIRFFAMGWPADAKIRWTIDGQEGVSDRWGPSGYIEMEWKEKKWQAVGNPSAVLSAKMPGAAGPIKEGFSKRFTYVVGTSGTPEETRANLAKARFDLETFYYRGNGAIEVLTDLEYEKLPDGLPGRNLVLVGNRDNNRAWKGLAEPGPIEFHQGHIDLPGGKRIEGADKGAMAIRPKKGEPGFQIVLISGTGPKGMRLMERISLWVSGSSFPDFLIMEPSMLKDGIPGIIAAGYFDSRWNWDPDQSALR